MTNGKIPLGDLPVKTPGDFDYLVGSQLGDAYRFPVPEVTNASRLLSESLHQVVADAEADIAPVIAGLGYLPPVPYASGLNVNSTRFTVIRDGQVYAPAAPVPFTTGTWNAGQWRLIQGVTAGDLAAPTGSAMVGYDETATVKQMIDSRAGVSVTEPRFGADPSGALESTDAIQAACDFAASPDGPGRVDIPAGTYRIRADKYGTDSRRLYGISVPSNCSIVMAEGAVLEVIPNSSASYSVFVVRDQTRVTIQGGVFRGDKLEHNYNGEIHEWGYAISVYGDSNGVTIRDIEAYNFMGDGVFIDCRSGAPNNVVVEGCTIYDCRRHELTVISVNGLRVQGNSLWKSNASLDGIHNTTYGGLNIDAEGESANFTNMEFIDNKFYCSTNACVRLDMTLTTQTANNITFSGNTLSGELGGIEIDWADNLRIEGNRIFGMTRGEGWGLLVRGGRSIKIARNFIEDCIRPITLTSELKLLSDVSLEGNTIRGGQFFGVSVSGAEGVSVIGSSISGSGSTPSISFGAMYFENCQTVSAHTNAVSGSMRSALYLSECGFAVVSGNILMDCSGYPLFRAAGGSDITVSGNTIGYSDTFAGAVSEHFVRSDVPVLYTGNKFVKGSAHTIVSVALSGAAAPAYIGNDYRKVGAGTTLYTGARITSGNILPDGSVA